MNGPGGRNRYLSVAVGDRYPSGRRGCWVHRRERFRRNRCLRDRGRRRAKPRTTNIATASLRIVDIMPPSDEHEVSWRLSRRGQETLGDLEHAARVIAMTTSTGADLTLLMSS